MKITLDVKEIYVYVEDGLNDQVWITVNLPSLLYKVDHSSLELECPHGTGAAWVREHLGVEPKVLSKEIPEVQVPEFLFQECVGMWSWLLAGLHLTAGRADARRIINCGGLRSNGELVLNYDDSWNGKDGTVIEIGKKGKYKLRRELELSFPQLGKTL